MLLAMVAVHITALALVALVHGFAFAGVALMDRRRGVAGVFLGLGLLALLFLALGFLFALGFLLAVALGLAALVDISEAALLLGLLALGLFLFLGHGRHPFLDR